MKLQFIEEKNNECIDQLYKKFCGMNSNAVFKIDELRKKVSISISIGKQ